MKEKLIFLFKLIMFSILITFILPWLDLVCRYVLLLVTSGAMPTHDIMKRMFYVSVVKLYPFLVLILATPNMSMKGRTYSITVGIGVYLVLDLIMTVIWDVAPFQKANASMAHIMATNGWEMLGKWMLPFLLWFVFAHRQIEGLLKVNGSLVK